MFFLIILMAAVVWLLWVISRNTGDALDKQTAIQYELVSLEKKLEQLSDKLVVQSVSDGDKTVEVKKPEASTLDNNGSDVEVAGLVNINKSSLKEIVSLPRIGKALGQKIIDARPYAKVDDLLLVQGVSKNMFGEIKSLVTVG